MLIGGLQKTTLIDFPGRVACTIFTVGCNFRCPFCHNKDLVTLANFKAAKIDLLKEEDFFEFLKKRKKILDGVCITGGEPTLHPDLLRFCQRIKKLGLEVKLDSNGSNPEILKNLIAQKAVDFIAMDIKTVFKQYKRAIGNDYPVAKMKKSLQLILQSGLECEFRTTIVPGIHNQKIITLMLKEVKEMMVLLHYPFSKFNYSLQPFRPKNCLNADYLKIKPFSHQEVKRMLKAAQAVFKQTQLKGDE